MAQLEAGRRAEWAPLDSLRQPKAGLVFSSVWAEEPDVGLLGGQR